MKAVCEYHYPDAVAMSTLQHNVYDKIRKEGGDGDHTIWATSLCSDEITNSFHYFTQQMAGPGPFILGGITGLPFAGVTGMKAFLSHVPTGGKAMIVYGPHIGITQEGELGKVHRKNQDGHSTCCGSITAAVASIRVHASGVQDDPLDYQQSRVIEHLNAHREDMIAGIPLPVVIFFAMAIILGFVLGATIIGRQIYQIGTNKEAALHAGINSTRIKVGLFLLLGLVSAAAGIMAVSRLGSVRYDLVLGGELQMVLMAMLGGTYIFGGRGTILGTFLAAWLLVIVSTGMTVANLLPAIQLTVLGILLIVAIIATNFIYARTQR